MNSVKNYLKYFPGEFHGLISFSDLNQDLTSLPARFKNIHGNLILLPHEWCNYEMLSALKSFTVIIYADSEKTKFLQGAAKSTVNRDEEVEIQFHSFFSNLDEKDLLTEIQANYPNEIENLEPFKRKTTIQILKSMKTGQLLTSVNNIVQRDECNLHFDGSLITMQTRLTEQLSKRLEFNPKVSLILNSETSPVSHYVSAYVVKKSVPSQKYLNEKVKIQLVPLQFSVENEVGTTKYSFENQVPIKDRISDSFILPIKFWLDAVRAPILIVSIIPILVGAGLTSYGEHPIDMGGLLLTLLGLVLIQSGSNILNDYFDHRSKIDDYNIISNPIYSGPRFIQLNLASPDFMILRGSLLLLLGGTIGLFLNTLNSSNHVLFLGLIGVFLAFFYTSPPLKFSYRSFGDLIIVLTFGPLLLFGSLAVQGVSLTSNFELTFSLGLLLGLYVGNLTFLNNVQTLQADQSTNKNTLATKMGYEKSLSVFWIVLIIPLISTPVLIFLYELPLLSYSVIISVFPTYSISREINEELINYQKITRLLLTAYLIYSLTLTVSLLLF